MKLLERGLLRWEETNWKKVVFESWYMKVTILLEEP